MAKTAIYSFIHSKISALSTYYVPGIQDTIENQPNIVIPLMDLPISRDTYSSFISLH